MSTAVAIGRPEEAEEEVQQHEAASGSEQQPGQEAASSSGQQQPPPPPEQGAASDVLAPPEQATMSNGAPGGRVHKISVRKEGVKVGFGGSKFDKTVWDINGKQFTKEQTRAGLCGGCCAKHSWKYDELEFVEPSSWCVCFQSKAILRVKKNDRLVGVLSRPDSEDNPCCPEEVIILKVTDHDNRQLFALREGATCADSCGPCGRVPPLVYCVQCCGWMPRISKDPGTCCSLWCTCLGASLLAVLSQCSPSCCCGGGSGGGSGDGGEEGCCCCCCSECLDCLPCLVPLVGCCVCVAATIGCASVCCRASSRAQRERRPGCCDTISIPMAGGYWGTPAGLPWDRAVDVDGTLAQHMFWRSTEIEGLTATFKQEASEEEALAFSTVLMWELFNPSPSAGTITRAINQEMRQHEIKK